MALSLMDVLNPRGALRQREKEQQLAEQKAQNDAMAQAMGYGEQPTLSTISAMPALPARETSFQGDGSRFGMTGTDEDYKRLFGPAAQQQPSQLHQEVQRQQGGIPKDNSPRGKMIRNMVMSDNPTVRSNGLQLAQQQMMAPTPEPKAARQRRIIKDQSGRQFYEYEDGTLVPVFSDSEYNASLPPAEIEEVDTGLSSGGYRADLLNTWNRTDISPQLRSQVREELQRSSEVRRPDNSIEIIPGMSNEALGLPPAQGNEVIAAPMSQKGKDKDSELTKLESSMANYRALLEQHGTEAMPGQAKDDLSSAHTDLLMQLKDAYKLGVLSGPDEALLLRRLPDPTAWGNQLKDGKRLLRTFDSQLVPSVKKERDKWVEQYGGKPSKKADSDDGWGELE